MYEQFWGLDCKPFEPHAGPPFYFSSEEQRATELKMRYAIDSRRAAALLTGAAGAGKTMMIEQLQHSLQDESLVFYRLQFPQLLPDQLLAYLAGLVTGERIEARRPAAESLRQIELALQHAAAQGRHCLLIIDEAHALTPDVLETLRLLLNFHRQGRPSMTMLLAGQPSMHELLDTMPQLEERLAVKLHLPRLSEDDTCRYVRHRLAAAGAVRPVFSQTALAEVHHCSRGVPGRINRLCDMALLVGFADDMPLITPEHIRAVDEGLFAVARAA